MTAVPARTMEVLRRIRRDRPVSTGGERCEMCAEPISDEHQHVVNIEGRQLMCVCRPCYLLFTDSEAQLRYRAVPDRYLHFDGFRLSPAQWDALEIPVGLAFFFRNSAIDRIVGFYPGPAGATESELPLQAWDEVLAANPELKTAVADVEAVIVRRTEGSDGVMQCYLVPIDACYQLVGRLRQAWRGFDGGTQARKELDDFFADVAGRARKLR